MNDELKKSIEEIETTAEIFEPEIFGLEHITDFDSYEGKRQIADAMQGHFQNGNLPKHWREEGYQRQMV